MHPFSRRFPHFSIVPLFYSIVSLFHYSIILLFHYGLKQCLSKAYDDSMDFHINTSASPHPSTRPPIGFSRSLLSLGSITSLSVFGETRPPSPLFHYSQEITLMIDRLLMCNHRDWRILTRSPVNIDVLWLLTTEQWRVSKVQQEVLSNIMSRWSHKILPSASTCRLAA